MIIYLITLSLALSHIIVDFVNDLMILQMKPFNCTKCLSFWLGLIICLLVLPLGSIEVLVIPSASYLINKIIDNYIV